MKQRSGRFVYQYDLVTTVPAPEMGYWHVGAVLPLNAQNIAVAHAHQPTLPEALLHDATLWGSNISQGLLQLLPLPQSPLPSLVLPQAAPVDLAPANYRKALLAFVGRA